MSTKMTIHRALSTLKIMDDRIQKAIASLVLIGYHQEDKDVIVGGKTLKADDFTETAKSQLQSVTDLINYKAELKRKIVESNAVTLVKIGVDEMSVATAITRKDTIVKHYTALITFAQTQLRGATATVNKNNENVEANLQRVIEATYAKETKNVNAEDYDKIATPFRKTNLFKVFDPCDVTKFTTELEEKNKLFLAEIDAVLSESNAITFIEI